MTTNYEKNFLANNIFGRVGTLPNTYYIGLLLASPNADGTNIVEVSGTGTGYVRQPLGNNKTELSQSNNGQVHNLAQISFPPVSSGGTYGGVVEVGIWDSLSGGNLKYSCPQTVTKQFDDGDIAFFDIGDVVWTVQDVVE